MNELHKIVIERLEQKKYTLSTAESCTGGLLGATFTDIAGSSAYYMGGVIAYNNSIKHTQLDVPQTILDTFGAVSVQTVEAMVRGVKKRYKTNCAISTSGIAGPGGGTLDKPVGLVFIGVAVEEIVKSYECRFDGDRNSVRKKTVEAAIEKLLWAIEN